MATRIAIVQGHPDPAGGHLCHALADAYEAGAGERGRSVRRIDVAALDFRLLRNEQAFTGEPPPPDIVAAQETIAWAEHVVIVYPLWLGTMPALLKAFLEQTLRPGFAFDYRPDGLPRKRLQGRSARVVVTMGMPALAYRWYFGAHSLKSLERNILRFCGISPVGEYLIGGVGSAGAGRRHRWLARMQRMGRAGV